MIEDWVKSRGKIERVTSVYDGYICTDSFEDSHDYYFDPIPITPEILKKNGFEEVGDNIWQLDVKSHWFFVDFDQYVLGCDLNTSTRQQENSFRILCVNSSLFIHELQHALRLCGIEKEIEL